MNIWNKKILNKAVTFLLTAVLLFWNAVQVEAAETALLSIVGRDSNQRASIIGSSNNGSMVTTSYETELQFTIEHFQAGYTYSADTNLDLEYSTTYFNSASDKALHVITDVKDVKVTFPDGSEYYLDFYYNTPILQDVPAGSSRGDSREFRLEFRMNDYYFDVASEVILTITLSHFTWQDLNSSGYTSIIDSSSYTLQDSISFNRVLGDHTDKQLDTIIDQNNTLLGRLTSWFEDLFQRMDEEQDELIYGYQDTTTSDAASAFSSESDKLTVLEGELSTQSNTYVTDYAAEGFDLGVLATIGSSLIFVTTWFTNFWNMGGVFTACLNFCFALSIVFFILRIKR